MARSRRRLFLALALSLPVPALVACQGIIGLDEFQKGECPGAHCGDGGTGSETSNVIDSPTTDQNNGDAGPGTSPVAWAKWKMPNYDAGTPDVENPLQYDTTTTPNVVKDLVTGLSWLDVAIPATTYDAAVTACQNQPGGMWRLPKRIELVSLLDFAKKQNESLYNGAFKQNPPGAHWTSSEVRTNPASNDYDSHWTVNFDTGQVLPKLKTGQASVRCVLGSK